VKEDNSNSDWLITPKKIIGVMTGTSIDGINIALAEFYRDYRHEIKFELLSNDESEIPSYIRDSIFHIINNRVSIAEVSRLNFEIARFYADSIFNFIGKQRVERFNIGLVGIHGQTVWHEPEGNSSTLQLASVPALAALIGIPVAGDFRSADIALGGQGAPLVPIFDYEFLRNQEINTIALNIGGISNITLLPAGCRKHEVIAFDTGPGNVLIDMAVRELFGKNYDNEGEIAFRGNLIDELSTRLRDDDFVRRIPPKSTGRERYTQEMINDVLAEGKSKGWRGEDIIHTLTDFTAWAIAENISLYGKSTGRLIVSGGGLRNKFIMDRLAVYLPEMEIMGSDALLVDPDAKEALCFAYLACLRMLDMPGNIPSVTGASREAILGVLAY
jgi:anhydro-N-acetylmuramic acid kinase